MRTSLTSLLFIHSCNQADKYAITNLCTWCVLVHSSLHMRTEEKPTRCHCMLYYIYDTLNMFRAVLCLSSGALDYMYAIATYGVQCLAAGCWGSASRVCDQEEGSSNMEVIGAM